MVFAVNVSASSPLFHLTKSDTSCSSSSSLSFVFLPSRSLKPRQIFFTNHQSFSSITKTHHRSPISIKACSKFSDDSAIQTNFTRHLKTVAATAVIIAVAMTGKFRILPARADNLPTVLTTEENNGDSSLSSISKVLESNPDAVEVLKSLVKQKLEAGEDEESLRILKKLVSAEPEKTEWKFLMARLLNEMGDVPGARQVFEEILKVNPLSFEALFENALLMDRLGEGDAVLRRLDEALNIAEVEKKQKEVRDVRFIMAQIHFLQKNVDKALKSYDGLSMEDPKDFRPYFCKGMIFSLLDKNK
ncbi:protein SLOW GREEN 1, chloroplastic isoform X2 [Impatiens glandulifera]|uniref:protein SLOW GREEN 1, chloroplastic isoform X2 n=1 Tax=Impatiens glandulifera TaxID=253017 RepID=UPI001FB09172|nr:protein SLOW GREEN 1, chloroplastic isoform X2 [Impatiens glandulifera]